MKELTIVLVATLAVWAILLVADAVGRQSRGKRRRVYISGPISGYDIQERRMVFGQVANRLVELGYDVVNPMDNEDDSHRLTWEEYMRKDITQLMQCDCIVLLSGWEKSRGARLEKQIAEELGMEVLNYEFKG